MKFVLFHGAFGSPQENWFPLLKEKLENLGQEVIAPQFPVDSWEEVTKAGEKVALIHQSLSNWLKVFERVAKSFKKGEKLCFVGHSLGPLFILHVVSHFKIVLDSAIFVSPFLDPLKKSWQIDHANQTFYKTDFDFLLLKKYIPESYVLHSDNDPYVDRNHSILFAKALDSSIIFVKKAGHMNSEVNLNEFPLVFELCNTRLDLSVYQKYVAHRRETVLDFLQDKHEKLIDVDFHLKPGEIFDEGRFKFRNLKYGGFCTFRTGLKDWDPENVYYQEARKAAKRVKDFTRVFIVEEVSDLHRPTLQKQMKLDLEAGIQIRLCLLKDIKDDVSEPDFGVWDNEYVCIIRYENGVEMADIELNSRSTAIRSANNWKKIILARSIPINNLTTDIEKFISAR